ncbi:hypothetical protein B0H19DRAFT_1057154 [Mycena capillaripes]|nr:hypothetical protein B0H19DRAFT_1057154 [Mycena capillaripes]
MQVREVFLEEVYTKIPEFKGAFNNARAFFKAVLTRREITTGLGELAFNVLKIYVKIYDATPVLRAWLFPKALGSVSSEMDGVRASAKGKPYDSVQWTGGVWGFIPGGRDIPSVHQHILLVKAVHHTNLGAKSPIATRELHTRKMSFKAWYIGTGLSRGTGTKVTNPFGDQSQQTSEEKPRKLST